jgi:hypothetical protein
VGNIVFRLVVGANLLLRWNSLSESKSTIGAFPNFKPFPTDRKIFTFKSQSNTFGITNRTAGYVLKFVHGRRL